MRAALCRLLLALLVMGEDPRAHPLSPASPSAAGSFPTPSPRSSLSPQLPQFPFLPLEMERLGIFPSTPWSLSFSFLAWRKGCPVFTNRRPPMRPSFSQSLPTHSPASLRFLPNCPPHGTLRGPCIPPGSLVLHFLRCPRSPHQGSPGLLIKTQIPWLLSHMLKQNGGGAGNLGNI